MSISIAMPPLAPWHMVAEEAGEPATRRARKERAHAGASTPGDGFDLDELYKTSYMDMVRLARQFVDDVESAQDVVHDAFLGLHRNRDGLENPANARAYLRTAVVNQARSALRRRKTAREYVRAAEPDVAPDASEPVLLAEEHAEVLSHLDSLPDRMREVLVLRYFEGMSEADIAKTLGVSQGTVKSQASRAIKKLAELMREGSHE